MCIRDSALPGTGNLAARNQSGDLQHAGNRQAHCGGRAFHPRASDQTQTSVSYTHLDVYKRQVNHLIEIQGELERNNAGFRKLPGTALKSGSGATVYTLSLIHI